MSPPAKKARTSGEGAAAPAAGPAGSGATGPDTVVVMDYGRGLHSFPFPLNLGLPCPFPLNLS